MVDDTFKTKQIFPLLNLLSRTESLGSLQVEGGINSDNCLIYIEEGVSHVVATSECY